MIRAELDGGFQPPYLVLKSLAEAAEKNPGGRAVFACERENGCVFRFEFAYPAGMEDSSEVVGLGERIAKFLLWSAGGWKLYVSGPSSLTDRIRRDYSASGRRGFDRGFVKMVYGREVEVVVCPADRIPPTRDAAMPLGGHLDGCRIGFDLGASDYKLTAMKDGLPIWSDELPWNPRVESDPDYHYAKLSEGLRLAASKLPRVDAIGGSTAGVVVGNRMRFASLFRSIPEAKFERASELFLRIRSEWGVPMEVANDGDVSALAGALSLGVKGIIGMALGSSEAVGYLDPKGCLTGRLSELAFAPVDLNPSAAADEWSGDTGVGAMYFSQQAVNRLAVAGGMVFPEDMGLPERLKVVQAEMAAGNPVAQKIYQSIGVYLGYTVPWYACFYEYAHLMLLGRVTSGPGGEVILETARQILRTEFPEFAEKISLFMPDEKARRVGQSAAAASLPEIKGKQ